MVAQPAIAFDKMSGSGNDFIIIDNRKGVVPEELLSRIVVQCCRRRLSVGADGLILVENASRADFKWRFFNADGSVAEMCGNGARCAARFAWRHKIAGEKMVFETLAGPVQAQMLGDRVRLKMTRPGPVELAREVPIKAGVCTLSSVNTGVPHAVIETGDLDAVDVSGIGREIRFHEMFAPAGTNVNFVRMLPDGTVAIRTYERGVEDETLACGTGAVAAAIVMAKTKGLSLPVRLRPRGGGILSVHFQMEREAVSDAFLEGDARVVYTGTLHPDAWQYGEAGVDAAGSGANG